MVPGRDTFGQPPAFFEKCWLVRFAADGGMRNADADSVLVLSPNPLQ
jgi:hypothetical protein